MLSWKEYIDELVNTPTVLDSMSLRNGKNTITVSPIVKASIQMLESMIETEGKRNVFVFPEIKELLYEFVLSKIVYNVAAGKINISYDPQAFKPGQKLKYKNCIVEFDEYVEKDFDGEERLYIRFSDGGRHGLPPLIAPIFQTVDGGAKRLSTEKAFLNVYSAKKAVEELETSQEQRDIIEALTDYKTHLDGSIFFVTNTKNAKEYFDQTRINKILLKDVLLIGKAQLDGNIDNCYAGQLSGNPAIVLASDLYSVYSAIERGAKVQSVIINLSQGNIIENQLDILDDISRSTFPVLCVTDTCNSFDLDVLMDRDYNVWRWDSNNLVESVCDSNFTSAKNRIQNCAKQNLYYEGVDCAEISDALQLLYFRKAEIQNQSTRIISTYNKLFSLLFTSLRIAVPFEREELERIQSALGECEEALNQEKNFLNQELYKDLMKVIADFEKVFVLTFQNPKVSKLAEIISSKRFSSVCIVISDKLEKMRCEAYWKKYAIRKRISINIKVLYPQEYANADTVKYDVTVIIGWLNNKRMRNVIYCYGTPKYIVITYACEEKWRKAHSRVWSKTLANCSNSKIVKNSFSKKAKKMISDDGFEETVQDIREIVFDELSDIENLIQLNTYRQYGVSSNNQDQVVDAYPISFVGGYLAFYRTGHKIISVTDIILGGNNVSLKTPDLLKTGEFVAIRESQRDIIRDIADKILKNSGMAQAREVATRWRDALNVETMFSTVEEIYLKLQEQGCTRGYPTVKNWIEDENQFSLSSREDLVCIAKALNDNMLLETVDEVFMAGNDVKRAHVKAGQYLSQQLKNKVATRLAEYGVIDAFNIWDPIELQLEDIGKVIILKIIDVNRPIQIEAGNTNRLLSE